MTSSEVTQLPSSEKWRIEFHYQSGIRELSTRVFDSYERAKAHGNKRKQRPSIIGFELVRVA